MLNKKMLELFQQLFACMAAEALKGKLTLKKAYF